MPSIHFTGLQALQAVVAVANDGVCLVLRTVIFHNARLLLHAVRNEFARCTLQIMLRSQLGISCNLRPVQGVSAEIGFLMVCSRFHIFNIHLFEQAAYGVLFLAALFGAPAVLHRHFQAAVIREGKIGILIDQLPQRMNGHARMAFLKDIAAIVAKGPNFITGLKSSGLRHLLPGFPECPSGAFSIYSFTFQFGTQQRMISKPKREAT